MKTITYNITQQGIYALLILLILLPVSGMAANINDRVIFKQSEPEGLFGPGNAVNEDVFTIDKLFSEQVGPITKGQIVNVDQDVPVETLQKAWNQALNTCTNYKYTVKTPAYCSNVTVTPTRNECITGKITSRTVKPRCCVITSRDYPDCGIVGSVSTNITVNVNRQLPVSIGPYPTQSVTRPTDIGAIVTYEADVEAGLELAFKQDSGSINVTYVTDVNIQSSHQRAEQNEIVTLTARHTPDAKATKMQSQFPHLGMSFRYFYHVLANADLEWAHMDERGNQSRGKTRMFHLDTAEDPDSDPEGRIIGELVSAKIGVTGMEVALMRDVPYAPENVRDRIWPAPLTYSWDITQPFSCPPLPLVGGNPCNLFEAGFSFDLAEILFRTPALDTPVSIGHDAGLDGFNGQPLYAVSNEIRDDGSIRSTSPVGWRPLNAGLLGDPSNIDWSSLAVNDGGLSNDFARLDIDLDGLARLAGGAPLGFNFSTGVKAIPLKGNSKLPVPAIDIEANALDLDIINFFSIDEEVVFIPNLVVVFEFDRSVEVRRDDTMPWVTTDYFILPVDTHSDVSLQFKMPEGGVEIKPVYSLRDNLFQNNMKWYYTTGSQATYLQLKVEGFLSTVSDMTGLPSNIALHQSTLASPPIYMGDTGSTEYSLENFSDVAGASIKISDMSTESQTDNGSGTGNAGGSNSSNGNSGGGCTYNPDAKPDIMLLIMFLLSGLYLVRRQKYAK